jgi:hypothetical protein
MNEDLLRRALQAFHRGYAGEPGTLRPRQAGKTAAGVQAVIELLAREALPFPREPSDAMEWAFHNGVPVNARKNFLNRYRAMRAAAVHELAAPPAPQADVCSCPEHGSWYHAEDIDRMVKEISDALGSTATHPKLCDIVVDTVRAIGARAIHSEQVQDVTDELVEVACRAYYNCGVRVRSPVFEGMRAALLAALAYLGRPGSAWTCFHCGETFTERNTAALHFGTHESQQPACTIDIVAFRQLEARKDRYAEEDADIHRQMHRMGCDHQLALRRAEEAGYARALKDTGYAAPTGVPDGWLTDPDSIPKAVIDACRDAIIMEFGNNGTDGYYKRILAKVFAATVVAASEVPCA